MLQKTLSRVLYYRDIVYTSYTFGKAAYTTQGAPRSAETEELQIPPSWSGDEGHTYLAFISEEGTEVATSTYCGVTKYKNDI